MKKFNTSPLSGMLELLPNAQAEFNRLKSAIAGVFTAHGFQQIETPTIERLEVLLAKAGGDTEKQIYKVVKTAETSEDADQALRFDHTVPLARWTVEHMNDLTFPLKVTQIGRNFRGERAQSGRFREFYQCDIDVIGRNTLAVAYDAEVIATLIDAVRVLPLPSFVVRISNRKLLSGLLEGLNLQQYAEEIFGIIDHAEKVAPERTVEALKKLGIGEENVVKVTTFMQLRGEKREIVPKLREIGIENATFLQGIDELEKVLGLLERKVTEIATEDEDKPRVEIIGDMLIVRGLDYYTGTVFETIVPEYREIGSVCSGGRYENLASNYTEQSLPGVGGSIGLSRLFYILQRYGLVKEVMKKPVDVCVIPISESEFSSAEGLASKLRRDGNSVDIVLSEKKLGDKMGYAAKVANYAIVVGEEEMRSGTFAMKNLETGETTELFL